MSYVFNGVTPVILGFLDFGPRSGYDIKAAVEKSTRFFWAASYGQLYPELRRLAAAGLIEGESAPRGARRRTVYTITEAGREALRAWLRSPGLTHEIRDEGLLKIFFAGALERAEALELLRAKRRLHEEALGRLRAIEPQARESDGFPYVVLQGGLAINEAVIEWCLEMERKLGPGEQ
jgi:DNA-binding PadR family transcriptional regulator